MDIGGGKKESDAGANAWAVAAEKDTDTVLRAVAKGGICLKLQEVG